MPRIALITEREGLSPRQQEVYDTVQATRGGVRGPFALLLHSPEICSAAEQLGGYLRFRTDFSDAVRECTIMATAVVHGCAYEFAAHSTLALTNGWVDQALVDRLREKRFDELTGDIGLGVRVARDISTRNALTSDLFDQAKARWGERGVLDLAAIVGYYGFLARIMNVFEV